MFDSHNAKLKGEAPMIHDIAFTYSPQYEDQLLRGVEASRPWDIKAEIRSRIKPGDRLLDIGCGTGIKLLDIAAEVGEVIGVEPNPSMREKATRNIEERGIQNFSVIGGEAASIPVPDSSIDIVTCMVAPHETEEVFRILKPGGIAIIEKIGERDKENIKQMFGSDASGLRGYLLSMGVGERARLYQSEFAARFSSVTITTGEWATFYNRAGLIALLEGAKTVRDFDRTKDAKILDEIERQFGSPEGIVTRQQRLLIVAKKQCP